MLEGPEDRMRLALEGRDLDGFSLLPRDFKPGRTEQETYFNVFLSGDGQVSMEPVLQGLFFMGRGEYIKAWVEFRYEPRYRFPDGTEGDLEDKGLTRALFALLGELIPPGGSMMAIYGAETHAVSSNTERGLKKGFPPQVTPLGYRLWEAGMRWFKDWYFSEGWLEGGMKLQATRPLDEKVCAAREAGAAKEMESFLAAHEGKAADALELEALERARSILSAISAGAS